MANPLYKDTMARYDIKQSQKIRHYDNLFQKLKNTGEEIPEELLKQYEYLRMWVPANIVLFLSNIIIDHPGETRYIDYRLDLGSQVGNSNSEEFPFYTSKNPEGRTSGVFAVYLCTYFTKAVVLCNARKNYAVIPGTQDADPAPIISYLYSRASPGTGWSTVQWRRV